MILEKEKEIILSFFTNDFKKYRKEINDIYFIKVESEIDKKTLINLFPDELDNNSFRVGEYIYAGRYGEPTTLKEIINFNFEAIDYSKESDGFHFDTLNDLTILIKDVISDGGIGKEPFNYDSIVDIMKKVKLEELNKKV